MRIAITHIPIRERQLTHTHRLHRAPSPLTGRGPG
jgi:hypothetical protein